MDEVTGTLTNPYPGAPITSDFGPRRAPVPGASTFHSGLDYGVAIGTPTRAMDGGTVIFADRAGSAGNVVVIDHGNGAYTRYLHLDGFNVRVGDVVEQGQNIAPSGNTGIGTGPHGHVELRFGGGATGDFRGGPGSTARAVDFEDLIGGNYEDRIVLQQGDKGSGVEALQQQLKDAGYDLGTGGPNGDGVDSDYGDRTRLAVEAFQRDQGFSEDQIDGRFGPQTRDALGQAIGQEQPADPAPEPVDPTPTPGPVDPAPPASGETVLDTTGPFAAVGRADLFGPGVQGDTTLGDLNAEQSYALGRAVLGDSYGAAALEAVDRELGDGQGLFVTRMLALGMHEGGLNFGRINPDPASGNNVGTFQIGGRDSTPDQSQGKYARSLDEGIATYERLTGDTVDREQLSPADRDVLAHIGYMRDRTQEAFNPPLANDQLLIDVGSADVQGEDLVRLMHREVQGGIRPIGESVRDWTTPGSGLPVDLAAVEARAQEPDATRTEPALPTLQGPHPSYSPAAEEVQAALVAAGYDLGTSGPNGDGVDGDYGGRTRQAVEDFQRDNDLDVDGVVGARTWAVLSTYRSEEIAAPAPTDPAPTDPVTGPAPVEPSPTEPTEPTRPSLGDAAPEAYSVRQFEDTIAIGTWSEEAARVQPSADEVRWVADTEAAGNPQLQVTLPGTVDPATSEIVARPGSPLEAVLAQSPDGVQIRTATQTLPDGQTSTGSYVLIDEAAVLAAGYPSLDAFAESVREDLAVQAAAPAASVDPADQAAADRALVDADPENAAYLQQANGLVRNLLNESVGSGPEVMGALRTASRENGTGLTDADVRETLSGFENADRLSDLEVSVIGSTLRARAEIAEHSPDLVDAVDRLDAASTPAPEAVQGDGAMQEVEALRVNVDSAPVGVER